jgi:hypothetical protein
MSAVIDATVLPIAAAAPAAEYSGFIGWVLSLMESLGEVGVGAAVFIETFVPRSRRRRCCRVRGSSPTTAG